MRKFLIVFMVLIASHICSANNPMDPGEPDTPIIIPIIIIQWPGTGLETTSSDNSQHENLVEDNDENITLNTNTNIPALALGTVDLMVPGQETA